MASEAQRLIGISLTKIAQSRQHRGGVSLHKNLLVATVLQKARYMFMEEAYNMVHCHTAPVQARPVPETELVGLTAEEADGSACQPSCARCDKENRPPEVTYLDLDSKRCSAKRRRAVAEWETEEAVQSILPKRSRLEDDDNVFLEEATETEDEQQSEPPTMEIDRITSLVSIFSFSMGDGKINRSPTPDLCSAQAKDAADSLQQRPFLAMTV